MSAVDADARCPRGAAQERRTLVWGLRMRGLSAHVGSRSAKSGRGAGQREVALLLGAGGGSAVFVAATVAIGVSGSDDFGETSPVPPAGHVCRLLDDGRTGS